MNITELKGIGSKTAEYFNRLSVYTVDDLVGLYPRDYDVYEEPVFINSIDEDYENSIAAVEGTVVRSPNIYGNGKFKILSVIIKDYNNDSIECVWYNMPFLKSQLKIGCRYIFRGKITRKQNRLVLEQPKMYTKAQYEELAGCMQPIYPLTKGLSNNTVVKAVSQALEKYNTGLEREYLPRRIREKYNLAEHNFAMINIHFPKSMEEYIQARHRLAFEEFFLFTLATLNLKASNERIPNEYIIPNDNRTDNFIDNLPFKLTGAQQKTWEEVKENMSGKHLMSRLIQGDVGSGKTIIAQLALMNTAFAGFQSAMMVPTEVLAKQQYESIKGSLEKAGLDIKVDLLTGSMTAAQKRECYKRISLGETDIIIGTHALIQEKVDYKNLALVITDEQHRFGVKQRESFSGKGHNPHVMVMSATPIPRTLAIILYGDLDISIINEMPANRLPIKNCVVDKSYRPNAYKFIKDQVELGRQCYVICPMVEESESIDAENVIDYAETLKNTLPSLRIEYLHGKMRPTQKNEIMDRFSLGDIDVLVSTTVIEVGVNVPNSTVMMVENAERFGLAQLHQLRGRVGRGRYQSYCIFVCGKKSEKIRERLNILTRYNDGFKVAEEDLKLRGPGDFFGVRQSGDFDFGIADIFTDSATLKEASDAAKQLLEEDPFLEQPENSICRDKLNEYTVKCLEKINL
ncbi:MAG: ATP-dependent DNA helicase RecG [Lachnospira sp.]